MSEELTKSNKDRRLTLDEMLDIFMGDAYKDFRERCNLTIQTTDNGEKYVPIILGWPLKDTSPLLYRHIVAEQVLQGDYHDIDWNFIYDTCRYFAIFELWMNPLVWVDALEYDDIVVAGHVAEEEYDSHRLIELNDLLNYVAESEIQDFANNIYMYDEDDFEFGHVKGMHEWWRLTGDVEDIAHKIINGGHTNYEEIHSSKYYDVASMRYRLVTIARLCGGKRAAEILHMLQDEWPKIKLWRTRFETMTEDDIGYFENGLFHGFDDLLDEWEGQGESGEKTATGAGKPDSSFFGTTYSSDVCEKELIKIINHSKNKAAACRELMCSATAGYFILSNKTDYEKADAINPWVAFTNKKYVFTGDDFRKARNS